MKDLYETLGVDKTATTAEIKAAYRKLAQKNHPDREGGDKQAFLDITEAYEVLKDEERRKRYDETGDISDVSRVDIVAMNIVTGIFESIIDSQTFHGNIIEETRNHISEEIVDINKFVSKQNKKLEKLNNFFGRVKATGENLFVMTLESKRESVINGINEAGLRINILKKAMSILDSHSDESPVKPEIILPQKSDLFRDYLFNHSTRF